MKPLLFTGGDAQSRRGRESETRALERPAAVEGIVGEQERGVEVDPVDAAERGDDVGHREQADAGLDHRAGHQAQAGGAGAARELQRRQRAAQLGELQVDGLGGARVDDAREVIGAAERFVRHDRDRRMGRHLRHREQIVGRTGLLETLDREAVRERGIQQGERVARGEAGVRVETEARVGHRGGDRSQRRQIRAPVAAHLHLEGVEAGPAVGLRAGC